jgi:cell division protein ZapA (FtsZ GTPase activity inhibitor)
MHTKQKQTLKKLNKEIRINELFVVVTCNFSMENSTLLQTNKHTHTKQKLQKNSTRISKLLFLPTIIITYNLFVENSTLAQK